MQPLMLADISPPNSAMNHKMLLDNHQKNACSHIASLCLLIDCIRLAQDKKRHRWAKTPQMAENHPALLGLCAFWDHFRGSDSCYEARIPYISIFTGCNEYLPLIVDGVRLPIDLNDNLRNTLKPCSVQFGKHFLVTFLAGRHVTAEHPHHRELHFYTVQGKPLFKEPLMFGQLSLAGRESQNDLALRTLKAMQHNHNVLSFYGKQCNKP